MRFAIGIFTLCCLLFMAAPARAQQSQDSAGSGMITIDDFADSIEWMATSYEDIVILWILPKNWEVAEQGVDPETGELDERMGRYVLMARAPMFEDETEPDMVIELSIYRTSLHEGLPEDATKEEVAEHEEEMMLAFLDTQISEALHNGLVCLTESEDMGFLPYGTGTRPPTYFFPLKFATPNNETMIYTFSSAYKDRVWGLRFLMKEEQVDNYLPLVALIVNNSFAMTEEEYTQGHYDMESPEGQEPPAASESE